MGATKGGLRMLARTELSPQEALVCTMVLVAAAHDGITDREIGTMSALVQTLPVFHNFSTEQLELASDAAISLLREEDGIAHAMRLIHRALEPRLRETAYVLACEVIAADRLAGQPALRMLEMVREGLGIDGLLAAAIERTTRARHQRL